MNAERSIVVASAGGFELLTPAGGTLPRTSHPPIRDGHQEEDRCDQKKHRRQRVDHIEYHGTAIS
ncbi:hypothetical protein JF781_08065 [Mycobacterium sp. WUMAC-067]|uniref:hypothetical protein n=1 Tax=unclassified Mycobacterium TaxID=2642494 RepID=UPI001CD9599F|nr:MULTISPECIES: hypothetical protein [unclassified Mycobacterium]MCA2242312.1 hypothetical protein [Mycobacterium sp. WUMAC-067]MCA2313653.1 hypothetical protein [Mycobacterium sp. WUMAC-025]